MGIRMTKNVAAFFQQGLSLRRTFLGDERTIRLAKIQRFRQSRRLRQQGDDELTPNTDEGFEAAFDLLGNVGMYMAACRRHEITEPSRETRGVVPRFATSHLTTHNPARKGIYKTFTSLRDEALFLDYNTRAIFAYKRAADALLRMVSMSITHPVAYDLLVDARNALQDVARWNQLLFDELDTERFFYCVRPYYKPYRVGFMEYRGANAGDFAGINEIDMLLGVCSANDSFYSQLLVDKFLYMMPEDQTRLRDCMRRESLLTALLAESERSRGEAWYQRNARMFIDVCEAHGRAAAQHHDQLVRRFIELPSQDACREQPSLGHRERHPAGGDAAFAREVA